jgi:hypothetical protein
MDIQEVIDRVDLSALSVDERPGFTAWLQERPNMQMSIESALRKGQGIRAFLIDSPRKRGVEYSVQIINEN